jgi:hypothetical protein
MVALYTQYLFYTQKTSIKYKNDIKLIKTIIIIKIQMPTLCTEEKCYKNASYNFKDEKKRLYCKDHIKTGMVIIKQDSRICITCKDEDKTIRASFNFPTETRPLYCISHSKDGMINLNNKNSMCLKCKKKSPSYGIPGKKATHCSKCSDDTMVDLVSNICKSTSCRKNATYGITGEKASHCKKHAVENMIDVKNQKCIICVQLNLKTPKQPTFGIHKATHCFEHKNDNMSDLKHKSQQCQLCDKRASYALPNNKPTHCTTHKLDNMIDVVSKMCCICNKKQPSYNYPKEKIPKYCSGCSLDGMIDIIHKYCVSCNLFTVQKPPHLCDYCKPKSTLKQKTREMKVVDYLEENKIEFIHNKSIGFVCGSYRPDIRIDANTHLIIIEIDEDQHKHYDKSCEISRMLNIHQAEGLRCVFIRYNPDACKLNNKIKIIQYSIRLKVLLGEIKKHMENIPEDEITVYRLYYDNDSTNYIQKYDLAYETAKLFIK